MTRPKTLIEYPNGMPMPSGKVLIVVTSHRPIPHQPVPFYDVIANMMPDPAQGSVSLFDQLSTKAITPIMGAMTLTMRGQFTDDMVREAQDNGVLGVEVSGAWPAAYAAVPGRLEAFEAWGSMTDRAVLGKLLATLKTTPRPPIYHP